MMVENNLRGLLCPVVANRWDEGPRSIWSVVGGCCGVLIRGVDDRVISALASCRGEVAEVIRSL